MTRTEKVSNLLKNEISSILLKEVSDPRIGLVSITDVEVTADLKFARVFISIFGGEETKADAVKGLRSASGFIQKKLMSRLEMKSIPRISFVRDDSIERGDRIFNIISKLKNEGHPPVPKKRKK